ncbi:MAG: hypothetical protein L7S56_06345 [Candidatus Poseidonia sp.]|nr:hypothetical protein [Poseidonia sp.]
MGGGGAAPKMKMSDALILTGTTLLLGALFMHAWVVPITVGGDEPPYQNGATMMSGDSFKAAITVENDTTLRLILMNSEGEILDSESVVMIAGQTHPVRWEITESGYYTYEIDTKGSAATLDVSVDRKYHIDMIAFPVGALLLAYGLYQHDESEEEEETELILDAVLDV